MKTARRAGSRAILANEVDGSGRFTLTLTRGKQVQQYNVELLLHRTLKSLTVSANGEAALLGPVFSRDITEYNVEVPEGTKALFITATPFFTESRGYRVTINGEEVTGGETAEVSFAGGSADVKITVSHTADEARGLAQRDDVHHSTLPRAFRAPMTHALPSPAAARPSRTRRSPYTTFTASA